MWYRVSFEARRRHATASRTFNVAADHEAGALLRAASLYESPFPSGDDEEYETDESAALLVTCTPVDGPPPVAP